MKARIKKTGEIVNIAEYATIELEMCDSYGDPVCLAPEDIELIQEQSVDEHWQDVRERAAIAAMQGILCAPIVDHAEQCILNLFFFGIWKDYIYKIVNYGYGSIVYKYRFSTYKECLDSLVENIENKIKLENHKKVKSKSIFR